MIQMQTALEQRTRIKIAAPGRCVDGDQEEPGRNLRSSKRAGVRSQGSAQVAGYAGRRNTAHRAKPLPGRTATAESFNSKLRDEFLQTREIFYSMKELRVLAERWRVHYNTPVRPHSSLGYRSPAPAMADKKRFQGIQKSGKQRSSLPLSTLPSLRRRVHPNSLSATTINPLVQNVGRDRCSTCNSARSTRVGTVHYSLPDAAGPSLLKLTTVTEISMYLPTMGDSL